MTFRSEFELGVGAVLVAAEVLPSGGQATLFNLLESQPAWSDVPVLVSTHDANSLAAGDAVALLGNVMLLERPIRVTALISSVRTALRARRRQYEIETQMLELERGRDAERFATQRKDEFLAMLGHELRNPLAPISNALQILTAFNPSPESRAELFSMMTRQVSHMVRLVDDLLDASRLSRGMITLHAQNIDLRDSLQAAIEQSRSSAVERGQTLHVNIPMTPIVIAGDAVRIAQIFSNLLNNAVRYGRDNGQIRLTASIEGQLALVTIEDDGTGISPEVLPTIFELFTQGERRHGQVQEGLGIGLSLVHMLVGLHGGSVYATSNGVDQGACFSVYLPVVS